VYRRCPIPQLNEEKGNASAPNLTKMLFSVTSEGGIRCIPLIQHDLNPIYEKQPAKNGTRARKTLILDVC